jgi:phospholipid-transporting ATPase
VPETIEYLLRANIRVWVITGDKQETAINIGYSSRLLSPAHPLIKLNALTDAVFAEALAEALRTYGADAAAARAANEQEESPFALVIDGNTLTYALSPAHSSDFLALAIRCSAVLCW